MRGKTFGSAPDRWTLGLWCEERPWVWSDGLQPSRAILRCPSGETRSWHLEYSGLWPAGRCDCGAPWAGHDVSSAHLETHGEILRSPFLLLEESLFVGEDERLGRPWRDVHRRWFPGASTIDPAGTARKAAIAITAILNHQARTIAVRPIIQRMLAMPGRDLSPAIVRSMVRSLGPVVERTKRIIETFSAYETMHTPSGDPGPRRIVDVIGPHAEAAVRAIVLGQTVETDDPFLSKYVEWLRKDRR